MFDGRAFVSGYLCRFLYPHLNVFSNVDTILFIQQFSNMKVHRSLVAFTSLVVPRATFGMDDEVQKLRGSSALSVSILVLDAVR